MVELALSLWAHLPLEAPLAILDRTMARFEPYDLDFAFEADQLRSPHPFAELIRLAFAPDLNTSARVVWPKQPNARSASPEFLSEAVHAEWHRIIMRFADRYGLWLPWEISEDETSSTT